MNVGCRTARVSWTVVCQWQLPSRGRVKSGVGFRSWRKGVSTGWYPIHHHLLPTTFFGNTVCAHCSQVPSSLLLKPLQSGFHPHCCLWLPCQGCQQTPCYSPLWAFSVLICTAFPQVSSPLHGLVSKWGMGISHSLGICLTPMGTLPQFSSVFFTCSFSSDHLILEWFRGLSLNFSPLFCLYSFPWWSHFGSWFKCNLYFGDSELTTTAWTLILNSRLIYLSTWMSNGHPKCNMPQSTHCRSFPQSLSFFSITVNDSSHPYSYSDQNFESLFVPICNFFF